MSGLPKERIIESMGRRAFSENASPATSQLPK